MDRDRSGSHFTPTIMTRNCILLLALVASFWNCAYGIDMSEAKDYFQVCGSQHKITPDEIATILQTRKLPESEDGKCFIECMMEKFGMMKDGKVDIKTTSALISKKFSGKPELEEKAQGLISKCNKEVKNSGNKCDYAVELAKCGMKGSKELGIPNAQFGY